MSSVKSAVCVIIATIATFSSPAFAAPMWLGTEAPALVAGADQKDFSGDAFRWSDGTAAKGASLSITNSSGLLDAPAKTAARFKIDRKSTGTFAASFNIGDATVGLTGSQSLTGTSLTLFDFGNSVGSVDIKLFYADGAQVTDLASIGWSILPRGETSGNLTDLGSGIFRLLTDGAGSGVDTTFSSLPGSRLLSTIELFGLDYNGPGNDWIGFKGGRDVVEVAPVPLPAAGLGLFSALGAFWWQRRRRTAG